MLREYRAETSLDAKDRLLYETVHLSREISEDIFSLCGVTFELHHNAYPLDKAIRERTYGAKLL